MFIRARFSGFGYRVLAGIAAVLCFVARAPAADTTPAPATDRTVRAAEFIDTLARGDFERAVTALDDTMKRLYPAPKLKDLWRRTERQAGKFQRQVGQRAAQQNGYAIVYVTCQFQRTTVDAKLAYDSHDRISSIAFLPTGEPTPAAPPKPTSSKSP